MPGERLPSARVIAVVSQKAKRGESGTAEGGERRPAEPP